MDATTLGLWEAVINTKQLSNLRDVGDRTSPGPVITSSTHRTTSSDELAAAHRATRQQV